jgi:hypothetical protein
VDQVPDIDEVGITTDLKGSLILQANQVQDYLHQSRQMHQMYLWDFVTHVDKRKIGRQQEEEYEADEQMGDL